MSGGNYMPWLILTAIVLVSLWWKGYLSFNTGRLYLNSKPRCPSDCTCDSCMGHSHPFPSIATAHDLGVAYHRALHDEAMKEVYDRMTTDRDLLIKERIAAPFSSPEPAGQDQAGAPAA